MVLLAILIIMYSRILMELVEKMRRDLPKGWHGGRAMRVLHPHTWLGLSNLKYFSEVSSVSKRILEVIRRVPKIDSSNLNGDALEYLSGNVEFRNVDADCGVGGRQWVKKVDGDCVVRAVLRPAYRRDYARRESHQEAVAQMVEIADRAGEPRVRSVCLYCLGRKKPLWRSDGRKEWRLHVGERGVHMSDDQKQKITIARAVLKSPKILLLDEATSALDFESERIVQEALDLSSIGRTAIVVAHRLSTIRHTDVIAVVQDSRVLEIDSHDHLIYRSDGLYSSLVRLQRTTAHLPEGETSGAALGSSGIMSRRLSPTSPNSFGRSIALASPEDNPDDNTGIAIFSSAPSRAASQVSVYPSSCSTSLVKMSSPSSTSFPSLQSIFSHRDMVDTLLMILGFVSVVGNRLAIPAFFMFTRINFNDMCQGSIEVVNENVIYLVYLAGDSFLASFMVSVYPSSCSTPLVKMNSPSSTSLPSLQSIFSHRDMVGTLLMILGFVGVVGNRLAIPAFFMFPRINFNDMCQGSIEVVNENVIYLVYLAGGSFLASFMGLLLDKNRGAAGIANASAVSYSCSLRLRESSSRVASKATSPIDLFFSVPSPHGDMVDTLPMILGFVGAFDDGLAIPAFFMFARIIFNDMGQGSIEVVNGNVIYLVHLAGGSFLASFMGLLLDENRGATGIVNASAVSYSCSLRLTESSSRVASKATSPIDLLLLCTIPYRFCSPSVSVYPSSCSTPLVKMSSPSSTYFPSLQSIFSHGDIVDTLPMNLGFVGAFGNGLAIPAFFMFARIIFNDMGQGSIEVVNEVSFSQVSEYRFCFPSVSMYLSICSTLLVKMSSPSSTYFPSLQSIFSHANMVDTLLMILGFVGDGLAIPAFFMFARIMFNDRVKLLSIVYGGQLLYENRVSEYRFCSPSFSVYPSSCSTSLVKMSSPSSTSFPSLQSIFRHGDMVDTLLMILGFVGAVGDGLAIPSFFMFARIIFNDMGQCSIEAVNEGSDRHCECERGILELFSPVERVLLTSCFQGDISHRSSSLYLPFSVYPSSCSMSLVKMSSPSSTSFPSLQSIFNHGDMVDMLMMILGFVGAVGDGLAIPAFFMFARIIFNDMGQGSIEAVNEFQSTCCSTPVKMSSLVFTSFPSLQSIFSHGDMVDTLLMILGFVGAVRDGLAIPIFFMFTRVIFNDMGQGSIEAVNEIVIYLVYLADGNFLASFMAEDLVLEKVISGAADGTKDEATRVDPTLVYVGDPPLRQLLEEEVDVLDPVEMRMKLEFARAALNRSERECRILQKKEFLIWCKEDVAVLNSAEIDTEIIENERGQKLGNAGRKSIGMKFCIFRNEAWLNLDFDAVFPSNLNCSVISVTFESVGMAELLSEMLLLMYKWSIKNSKMTSILDTELRDADDIDFKISIQLNNRLSFNRFQISETMIVISAQFGECKLLKLLKSGQFAY
ncbi:hypothetical protein ZIOFF_070390 [Zingiber officinale]|uniref:ABC transporter domain-containing protein n=1 Tax=Zingiber officinale TaxID=94328 RepID=A0A8J5EDJ8_ZINOF|nr:hypothetical protein ZIOFF_070390 [Zingiber officinale]